MRPTLRERIFDYTQLAFWVGLIITMYVMAALINLSAKNTSLRNQADALEENNIQLESQIDDLKAQVAYYDTDEYRERLVREKLGLQAPGESVVILGPGDAKRQAQSAVADDAVLALPERSHFEEWLSFLFGSENNSR